MSITFNEAASTWGLAMETKNLTSLEMIMCDETFSWNSINGASSSSKEETLNWVRNTDFKIGNYKTLYNGEGVICGTHSVFEPGKDETIVMCVIKLSEDGTKVGKWSITRANIYQNTSQAHLGFFL
tara:strand:- start:2213 stop:2590 length:378 start_codon:yes stop_codon:yes gene_type:complete